MKCTSQYLTLFYRTYLCVRNDKTIDSSNHPHHTAIPNAEDTAERGAVVICQEKGEGLRSEEPYDGSGNASDYQ